MPDDKTLEYYRYDPQAAKIGAEPGMLEKLFKGAMTFLGAQSPDLGISPMPMTVSTPVKMARQALMSKILGFEVPSATRATHSPMELQRLMWLNDTNEMPSNGVLSKIETLPTSRPIIQQAVEDASPLTPNQYAQQSVINARDNMYHATDPQSTAEILNSGQVNPSEYGNVEDNGASFSRVPRVLSKGSKAVSLVFDRNELPRLRPFAEPGYQKTLDPVGPAQQHWSSFMSQEAVDEYNSIADKIGPLMDDPTYGHPDSVATQQVKALKEKEQQIVENAVKLKNDFMQKASKAATEKGVSRPNPRFEYESRTFDEPAPVSALKKILIDKEALAQGYSEPSNFKSYIKSHPGYKTFLENNPTIDPTNNPDAGVEQFLYGKTPAQMKDFRYGATYELIRDTAQRNGLDIPIETVESGKQLHRTPAEEIYNNSPLLDMLERIVRPQR